MSACRCCRVEYVFRRDYERSATICQGKKVGIDLETLVTSDGIISYHLSQEDAESGLNPLFNTNVNPAVETDYFVRSVSIENDCFMATWIGNEKDANMQK